MLKINIIMARQHTIHTLLICVQPQKNQNDWFVFVWKVILLWLDAATHSPIMGSSLWIKLNEVSITKSVFQMIHRMISTNQCSNGNILQVLPIQYFSFSCAQITPLSITYFVNHRFLSFATITTKEDKTIDSCR